MATALTNNAIRLAAGAAIIRLIQARGSNVLDWAQLGDGFEVLGHKVKFAGRAVGIFKPKELSDGAALSIKQVLPSRSGRLAPYDDSDLGEGLLKYRLERSGRDNRYLAEAFKRKLPLIFLRGVADARYEVIFPVFVEALNFDDGEAVISLNDTSDVGGNAELADMVEEPIAQRYASGFRKSRLHQRAFRQRVLLAYGLRCALTGLPLPELLDAAHIIPDARGGEASIRNGIALSKLHHVAFETNLLGIDADGRVHLSETVKRTRDGPMFSHGLLQLEGTSIRRPNFEAHWPNRDFLAVRFDEFRRQRE
jgi:putative restriction endonuclease